MITKDEILEEIKEWLSDKKQEVEDYSNEEAMQWQEDAEQPESEFYEIAKTEYYKVLKRKGDCDALIETLEEFLHKQ